MTVTAPAPTSAGTTPALAPDTAIADRFAAVRSLTDVLTSCLSAEDQTPQSMTD